MLIERINGNTLVAIEEVKNGFEIGYTQTRLSSDKPWGNKIKYMRNIEPLWFSKKPVEILKECGVETTERRASDLSNLFDGTLNGYYYVSMASTNGSDEPAKLLLGYISETFKDKNLNILDINKYIPAPCLKVLIEYIEAGKINKKFQKEFIDLTIIKFTESNLSPEDFYNDILKDPKYVVMDTSKIHNIVEQVFNSNPKAVEDAKINPKKSGFLVGQVMKLSKGSASPQEVSKIIQDKLGEQ